MITEEFIELVNTTRKANKDKWYTVTGVVNNVRVSLKGYGTWIQRIEIVHPDITLLDGSPSGLKVSEFLCYLKDVLDY